MRKSDTDKAEREAVRAMLKILSDMISTEKTLLVTLSKIIADQRASTAGEEAFLR